MLHLPSNGILESDLPRKTRKGTKTKAIRLAFRSFAPEWHQIKP
jgi:hypothetical protein